MADTAPDFSPLAAVYARARPRYPAALYAWLAGRSVRHELAWDCATGNGQAAVGLVEHFRRVVATDASAEQVRHATPHERIDFRVARAESSGLERASVDLVTVAAAAHWLDLEAFGAEARRVLRPGGLLAVWSYHAGIVEAPFDELFWRLYRDVLKPYFAPGARLVDERYESLALPGTPIAAPRFEIVCEWTLDQVIDYIGSWSSVAAYRKQHGEDPIRRVSAELERLWGDPGATRTLRLPLFLRVQRVDGPDSPGPGAGR